MLGRRIILLVVVGFGIVLFFRSETYSRWIDTFILNPNTPIAEQMAHQGVEERRQYRYQNVYNLIQYIKKTLDTSHYKDEPIILLPPNKYLDSIGETMVHMPEPAEFYYHSGLITAWTTSTYVNKCNWAIVSRGPQDISFIRIDSTQRNALLEMYKNFKPAL